MMEFKDHIRLLDQLTSPIYVKDINHCWVYVNPAFCELFDHPKDFLLGKSDYDVTPKEQSDVFWEKDNEVFSTKQTNINIETTTNSRGEKIWVESKKSYFENAKGEKFIFGILTDITLLKTREFELEEAWQKAKSAELAKSQFLANMSHEIRTPMNGIMGMTDLLEECDLPPRQKDFVDIIQRSGSALLTIINDILDFSKIEAGQLIIDPAPFVLRDCIEDVIALLAPAVADSGIELLLRIQPGLPETYVGDAGRIRQILTNIIGNAVKFTLEGHVYINVDGVVTDETVQLNISIEDTGIGIPEAKIKTIFNKFSQADASTTREFGGTGLGLNIAKELVQLMGGNLTATSQEGKGSCFSFTVDLPKHDDILQPKKSNALISDLKILIIDDNKTNRIILTEQLNHWGCKSVAVESADLAMAVLNKASEKKVSLDLILTDYQMPKKNGEDLIRLIKSDKRFNTIPSIMLSSVDRNELRLRMTGLGVDKFLTKPTRSSALKEAISEVCINDSDVKMSMPLPTSASESREVKVAAPLRKTSPTIHQSHVDVLIAEDNKVNQLYVSYAMDELSLSYKVVPNGRLAVEEWKALSPKLILMDISMPEMNGYEATSKIRELETTLSRVRTPIIAVTAHALKGDKEECLRNDMDGYLAKPLGLKSLTECLQNWGVMQSQKQA